MKKIKVLQIIDQLGGGGAERVVAETAMNLPSEYDVLVCVTRQQGNFSYTEMLRSSRVPFTLLKRRWRYSLAGLYRLWKLVRDFKPDIVHTHKFGSNVWGRLLRPISHIPVLICHEHTWDYNPRAYRRIWVNRTLAPLSDAIIAVSEEDKAKLTAIEKLPANKIVTIYNGIDFSRIDGGMPRDVFRASLDLDKNVFVIAIIGKLLSQKGHETLLKALRLVVAEFANVHLLIAGEGALGASLRQQTVELNLQSKVSFLGFRNDVGSILRAVDVVVMPSLFEGHPITLLEAMAAGKLVIATRVGGIPEVIKADETGILISPSDPQELATAILGAICNKEQRETIGKAAAEDIRKRFSIQSAVKQYVELYEDLLMKNKCRS